MIDWFVLVLLELDELFEKDLVVLVLLLLVENVSVLVTIRLKFSSSPSSSAF